MAYYYSKMTIFMICSVLVFSLIISFVCALPSQEVQPSNAEKVLSQHHQVYNIKKMMPLKIKNERGMMMVRMKQKRKKLDKNFETRRVFSAMLPKGYVPPSGSSPCHNVYPNSVTFFCDLYKTDQKP
ncbi:hypothetical protein LIER_09790 [Lithospermum erythrorhizon]|uniref:Transmembrane protein n=1 Tax=Lithospermum erythrorhizon TaxID=34254 RepID=A0AAV3PH49_LITER